MHGSPNAPPRRIVSGPRFRAICRMSDWGFRVFMRRNAQNGTSFLGASSHFYPPPFFDNYHRCTRSQGQQIALGSDRINSPSVARVLKDPTSAFPTRQANVSGTNLSVAADPVVAHPDNRAFRAQASLKQSARVTISKDSFKSSPLSVPAQALDEPEACGEIYHSPTHTDTPILL